MSLEERMDGVLSANKPIDAEFCKRVGMEERAANIWNIKGLNIDVDLMHGCVYISEGSYHVAVLLSVNTQGRFLHLLAALGIEVPG